MPRIFVIGGPNGAGKTTVASGLLPEILECEEYVNADAIAKALSPFAYERVAFKAGRLMLDRIHELAKARRDFAFETTVASRSFVPFLKRSKAEDYEIRLVFLWLRSVRLAQSRVAKRVLGGGHDIAKKVIKHRYRTGIQNFLRLYVPQADQWVLYDNSGDWPKLAVRCTADGKMELREPGTWRNICGFVQ
jgi:predicted ABC-type ATPase